MVFDFVFVLMLNSDSFLPNLGFGTSTLHRLYTKHRACRLISYCIEKGFTHFDTARMYGDGFAESVLGNVLSKNRDCYSITTKFGIPANPFLEKYPLLIGPHRIANKFIPSSPAASDFRQFVVSHVQQSLENSLRSLKTGYIDYFLAHEPTINHLSDLRLLTSFLESVKNKGYIRHYGFAVSSSMATELIKLPLFSSSIFQTAVSVDDCHQLIHPPQPCHFSYGYFRAYKKQSLGNPFSMFSHDVSKASSCILFSSLKYDHISKASSLL